MNIMAKKLDVRAGDDPNSGWWAVVSDGATSLECRGDYVMLPQLADAIIEACRRTWPQATKFTVKSCVVDQEDDCGMLLILLKMNFTNM